MIRHKRNFGGFVALFIFTATLAAFAYFEMEIPLFLWAFLIANYTLYVYVVIHSIKCATLVSKLWLKKYERRLVVGEASEYIDKLEKKPFFITDTIEKVEYFKLCCRYRYDIGDYSKAYAHLLSINSSWLYNSEKRDVDIWKSSCLIFCGAVSKARLLLQRHTDAPDMFSEQLFALIEEKCGNFSKAEVHMKKSVDLLGDDNKNLVLTLQGYVNFGRLQSSKGNELEALHYFQLAYKKYSGANDNRFALHKVYQHLILQKQKIDASDSSIDKLINEYKDQINVNNPNDLIEYQNFLLSYYNGVENLEKLYSVLKENYEPIRNLFRGSDLTIFTITTLTALLARKLPLTLVENSILDAVSSLQDIETNQRLILMKELYGVIVRTSIEPWSMNQEISYAPIVEKIIEISKDYYPEKALQDLDTEISKLEEYEVYRHCSLLRHQLWIQKWHKGRDFYTYSIPIHKTIIAKYHDNGLLVAETMALLDLAGDGCVGHNKKEYDEASNTYLEKTLHDYSMGVYEFKRNIKFRYLHLDVITDSLEKASNNIEKLNSHPCVLECLIRISVTYLQIDDKEKAKDYFEKVQTYNIDLSKQNQSLKEDYWRLERDFFGKHLPHIHQVKEHLIRYRVEFNNSEKSLVDIVSYSERLFKLLDDFIKADSNSFEMVCNELYMLYIISNKDEGVADNYIRALMNLTNKYCDEGGNFQEVFSKMLELCEQHPNNSEFRCQYVKGLFNYMNASNSTNDKEAIFAQIEMKYLQDTSTCILEVYARAVYNLLFSYPHDDIEKRTKALEKLSSLYEVFSENVDVAICFAKGLHNFQRYYADIALKQMMAKQLKIINEQHANIKEVTHEYAKVITGIIAIQQDDDVSLVYELERLHDNNPQMEEIALMYMGAWIRKIPMDFNNIEDFLKKLKSIKNNHPNSIKIAEQYGASIGRLLLSCEDEKAYEILEHEVDEFMQSQEGRELFQKYSSDLE